ncbi:MAG TPA: hypothetical protein VHS59_11075 [Bacillota bacterium]|nr:hypothetical protein [Bacillota bacterium]
MKIEGFFRNLKEAKMTAAKLEQAGFAGAFVDMNEHTVDNWNAHIDQAGSVDAPTLSALVLESGAATGDEDSNPLKAANPMVSGMGGFEEVMDINCKVTVEVDREQAQAVKEIISSMGGTVDNPNIQQPNMTLNTDLNLERALDKLDQGL